jgi:hypothetical protein
MRRDTATLYLVYDIDLLPITGIMVSTTPLYIALFDYPSKPRSTPVRAYYREGTPRLPRHNKRKTPQARTRQGRRSFKLKAFKRKKFRWNE